MVDPRLFVQLYTKLVEILSELTAEDVPKFQCHINHFINPNYYKKNKEFTCFDTAVSIAIWSEIQLKNKQTILPASTNEG